MRRSLLFNSAVYIVGQLATKALAFVLLVVYAHFLEPADFGITGTLGAYGSVGGAVVLLGLHASLARHYFDLRDDPAELARYLGSIYAFQTAFALALTLAVELVGPALWPQLTSGNIPFAYVRLALWTTFFTALTQIPQALYQVEEQAGRLVLWQTIQGALLLALGFVFVAGLHEHALGVLRSQLLAAAVVGVGLAALFARRAARTLRGSHVRTALAFGLPLLPHTLGSILMQTVDRILLEKHTTQADLGLYTIAMTLGMITAMIAGAINQAWAPHFLRTHAEESPGEARKKAEVFASLFVALFTGLSLVAALLGHELIWVLGPKYEGVLPYLVPFVIGNLVGIYAFVPSNQLLLAAKTRWFLIATTIAATISVALDVVLIPRGVGGLGAAWIFVTGTSVQTMILLLAARLHQRSLLGLRHAAVFVISMVGLVAATREPTLVVRVGLLVATVAAIYVLLVHGNVREVFPPRPQRA